MEPAKPAKNVNKILKNNLFDDLQEEYKKILNKHLDDRTYNENKIKNWMNYILLDAKEYFIKKYPDYDLFILCFICDMKTYLIERNDNICIVKTDGSYIVKFENDNLYCSLHYFFFKKQNLNYSLVGIEADIIKKGNQLLFKYLEDRKFNYDKNNKYSENINNEHNNFILEKISGLRLFVINRIFKNPISKFDFTYISHGKDIYKSIFQNYQNNSLICTHDLFFFK